MAEAAGINLDQVVPKPNPYIAKPFWFGYSFGFSIVFILPFYESRFFKKYPRFIWNSKGVPI